MAPHAPRILFIGYGNPGRGDDGLGPALADRLEPLANETLTVDSDYQLTVENSADVARHDIVIFADATVKGAETYFFREIKPEGSPRLDSHGLDPESVILLAKAIFGAAPKAYLLGVRGYEFEQFELQLSTKAAENLENALQYVKEFINYSRSD